MTWFRLELGNKITKTINTKTISTVYQNKNHLTITYNYTSTRSFYYLAPVLSNKNLIVKHLLMIIQ